MDTVKVAIASSWIFSDPSEILEALLNIHTIDVSNAFYDDCNHQFVIDCRPADAARISKDLLQIIQTYIREYGTSSNNGINIDEEIKIKAVECYAMDGITHDDIWKLVDSYEYSASFSSIEGQLIPQITQFKPLKHSSERSLVMFADATLADIARSCECDIVLEASTNRIRLTGWSTKAVQEGLDLLDNLEERYELSCLQSSFDFLDDEGYVDTMVRFVKLSHVIDQSSCLLDRSRLCELTTVEWESQSRHWRILRKPKHLIATDDHSDFWNSRLQFQHSRENNNPKHWQVYSSYSETATDGSKAALEIAPSNVSQQEANASVGSAIVTLEIPTQDNPLVNTTQAPSTRRSAVQTTSLPNSSLSDPMLQRNPLSMFSELSPNHVAHTGDHRISLGEDGNNKEPLIDFELLQGPRRRPDITQGSYWEAINNAHKMVMEKVSLCRRTSLSFEVKIGRLYIYTLTIPAAELRPHRKEPAEAFKASQWNEVFRTNLDDKGASTLFSPVLTKSPNEASFLVDIKIGKGEQMFVRAPKHKSSWFELECHDEKYGLKAVIEIHEKGDARFVGLEDSIGSVNIHYPFRTWDCCWQVLARKRNFTFGQEKILQQMIDSVFVQQDKTSRCPALFTQTKMKIISARLIRETVHRSKVKEIKLCMRKVENLQIRRLSGDYYEIHSPESSPYNHSHSWWEAKLVAPALQKKLEEDASDNLRERKWDPSIGSEYLRLALQVGSHIVTRIDSVGHSS